MAPLHAIRGALKIYPLNVNYTRTAEVRASLGCTRRSLMPRKTGRAGSDSAVPAEYGVEVDRRTQRVPRPVLPHCVTRQHLHVVGALEGAGLRDGVAAHAALHLLEGIVLVLAHPHQQLGGDGIEEGDAAFE